MTSAPTPFPAKSRSYATTPIRPAPRRLRVSVLDLVTKGPTRALYARVMHANLASIMPQVVAAWCEAEGHEVTLVCYTGLEIVPMIGSLGCPYTCSFCIDSVVPYQPLDFGVLAEDLRFLAKTMKRPRVTRYTFSPRAIVRRFRATQTFIPRWMNVVRAVSSEGFGRLT